MKDERLELLRRLYDFTLHFVDRNVVRLKNNKKNK